MILSSASLSLGGFGRNWVYFFIFLGKQLLFRIGFKLLKRLPVDFSESQGIHAHDCTTA